jgi:hypothetical protein
MNGLIHHSISDIIIPDKPLIMTLEACQEVIKEAARLKAGTKEDKRKILKYVS